MIISIRGTSGSGKTHLVRQIIGLYPIVQELTVEGKPGGYLLGDRLRVYGPYNPRVQAAGADAMRRFSRNEKYEHISWWAEKGDVIYEGLMESNEVGRTAALAQRHESHIIFLDHPLEGCLEAINARRAQRGVTEPVNPKKTTEKFEELERVRVRLRQAWVNTYLLPRDEALAKVKELLSL